MEPRAAIFAYQVDSSSDSTRRLTLTQAAETIEMWAVVQRNRYAKGSVYGLNSVSQQVVSVQKLVPSFYWTSQPDGICRGKCKCLTKEKRERARPAVCRQFIDYWNGPSARGCSLKASAARHVCLSSNQIIGAEKLQRYFTEHFDLKRCSVSKLLP